MPACSVRALTICVGQQGALLRPSGNWTGGAQDDVYLRVAVPLVDSRVGAEEVKVPVSIDVPHKDSFAALKNYWERCIVVSSESVLPFDDLKRHAFQIAPSRASRSASITSAAGTRQTLEMNERQVSPHPEARMERPPRQSKSACCICGEFPGVRLEGIAARPT